MRYRSLRLSLIACLALLLSGCAAAMREAPTPTPLPALVEAEPVLFTVERGPIKSQRDFFGEVVPARQDELFFRATGYVTRLSVQAGDLVKEGDLLAEQGIDDLLDQLAQARINLQVAQSSFENERLQHAYEVKKAESDVAILAKQVEIAERRVNDLYGHQKVDAQAELDIARQRLETAQAWLDLVKEKQDSGSEGLVEHNRLTVERLERLVAERQIIAPYDGIVLNSYLRLGSQVDAFNTAFVVGDPSELIVRLPYDSELGAVLEPATEAYISLTRSKDVLYPVVFQPDFLPATSKKVGPAPRSSGPSMTYFYFAVPDELSPDQLPLGGGVTVVVVLGKKDDVLLLPPAAIRGTGTFNYVVVMEDDYHRRVEVLNVGLKGDKLWEVVAELQEGDQVLAP